ncbi:MAG: 2-oxoacid:ferredoxin oxidoreductase subunit beta, partial [Candidatus Phosphoribacter baldrii]
TKGQYSPTSRAGTVSKSSPLGSLDTPFTPVSVALGAEATFVARTMDSDRKHLTEVLHAAARHRGAALVEIYQNCPIFNDGAFDVLKDKDQAAARILWLQDGEEVAAGDHVAVRADDGSIQIVPRATASPTRIVRHSIDTEHPSSAFALSRLTSDGTLAHVPMGVFRQISRPTYDDMVRGQVSAAVDAGGGPATDADLAGLLAGRDTWTVSG